MPRKAAEIIVLPEELNELQRRCRAGRTEKRMAQRSQLVLLCAEGKSTTEVAALLKVRPTTVSQWRGRFARERLAGLLDLPRSGRKAHYRPEDEKRILKLLEQKPPPGYARWNGGLLAARLQDISDDQVWRVMRKHRLHLQRRQSWCVSTDPEFARKAADITGLYLDPPENALVLCVDEKPSIQALERAQGYIRLPNGKAVSGFAHDYKRHGTTTLFAALNVARGLLQTRHYQRRRRREFLDFMNAVVAQHPGQQLHIVLDNLNTHKPKQDRWLKQHPNVHFHFTPTHASWLNQVEIWFSILSRNALRGASFTSTTQLREAIDAFINAYNQQAAPFEWTKAAVKQQSFRHNIADLCK
jgi:transposase